MNLFRRLEKFVHRESRKELHFAQTHFLDPSGLLVSHSHQVDLWNRQVHRDEHFGKRAFIEVVHASPYITGIVVTIMTYIPVVGWILGAAIAALSGEVARYAGQEEWRLRGHSMLESRQYGRRLAVSNWIAAGAALVMSGLVQAVTPAGGASGPEASGAAPSDGSSMAAEQSPLTNWKGDPGVIIKAGEEPWSGGQGIFSQAWNALTEKPLATAVGAIGIGAPFLSRLWSSPVAQQVQAGIADFGALFGGGGSGGGSGGPGPGGGDPGLGTDPGAPSVAPDYLPYVAAAAGFLLLVVLLLR